MAGPGPILNTPHNIWRVLAPAINTPKKSLSESGDEAEGSGDEPYEGIENEGQTAEEKVSEDEAAGAKPEASGVGSRRRPGPTSAYEDPS